MSTKRAATRSRTAAVVSEETFAEVVGADPILTQATNMNRYFFAVGDFHPLLLAGLPAHYWMDIQRTRPRPRFKRLRKLHPCAS